MQWITLLAILIILYTTYIHPRIKKPSATGWQMTIALVNGIHKVKVPDEVYESLKVWLRGEGDSLFEISADEAYLGLKRAHVVSVKANRK